MIKLGADFSTLTMCAFEFYRRIRYGILQTACAVLLYASWILYYSFQIGVIIIMGSRITQEVHHIIEF